MSVPVHAARMSPVAMTAVLRIGRHWFTLRQRPPRRVANLLVRMLARLLGARAAWGRTAALALLATASLPVTRGAHAASAPPPALSASALPAGANLAAGQATVAQTGNRMDIVQQSGKAILNWDSFNIGTGAAVTFHQPGADAVILNRVASNAPSQLLGSLSANGKVWLVNPAGIMVGQGATVDLHGFVASTLAVRDDDFLAGRMLFNANPQAAQLGAVRNDGTINTSYGGTVYLVAPTVQNHGLIRAPGGEVVLAAGASVELLDTATPGVRVAVSGAEGSALNLGQIISTAGRIGMAGVLVKNSGVLNASSVVSEGGRIFLRATKTAVVDGGAQMLATGSHGGRIDMTGGSVAVQGNALLDASGASGGGTVLVGGDYQGGGDLPRAQTALLGADAVLRADAQVDGNGGKVVLWSDQATLAQGAISARGGALGGDGGLVETSGLRHLSITGLRTDTTAARGKTGNLLLDPANIVIGAVADADGAGKGVDASGAALDAATYPGATSKMTAEAIATLLASTSVSLAATNDISIDTKIEKSAGGDQSLTLNAGRDIWLRQPVNSTSGALALNLTAGGMIQSDPQGSQSLNGGLLTAHAGGNLSLGNVVAGAVAATSTGGSVTINAPAALTLSGNAGTRYAVTAGGNLSLSSLNAGDGIAVNADGHQILFKGGTLQSGGNQAYQGSMLVSANTTFSSGGTVEFNGTLIGTGGGAMGPAPGLTITNAGLATLANGAGALGALSVSGPVLLKGNVTTAGEQTYTGQVQIAAPVVLKGSTVTLSGGGAGNGGETPATLMIQATNTSLAGTFDGFQRVSSGGTLAVTSLSMDSPWGHSGALNLANSGTLTASGGVLLSGAVALGADAVLTLASSANDAIIGTISGAGAIVKSGAGKTSLNSANTYSGTTTVNGGTLTVAADNALGSGNLVIGAGGTVSLNANAAISGKLTSAGVLSGTGTLSATGGYQLDGGTVSANLGSGTLTQASGTTLLSGSHAGATVTISGGTLAFGAADRLSSNAAVTIDAAGTLDTSGFAQAIGTLTSAGTVSAATGRLTAVNGYTLTGGTLSGQLAGGDMAQMAGNVTLSGAYSGNAIKVLGGAMTIGSDGLQAGAALLQTAAGAGLTINGATSTVNLLNHGSVDLSAALSVASGVSENAGVLNINGMGGQFAMADGTAFTNTAAGTVTLAGTHATPISGLGTFVNAGTFNKTSAGTQTAVLTEQSGTLAASKGALTLSGLTANAGRLEIGSGATLAVAGGTLTNHAGAVLAGSGTLDLGMGALINHGKVSPGADGDAAIGTLSVQGDYQQGSGGVLAIDLGGDGAGQSDRLAIAGKAALDGTLTAVLASGYKPVAFQPIAIVTAGGARSGTFSKVGLPADYQPGYGLAKGEAVRVNLVANANYYNNGAGTLDWNNRDNWSQGKTPGNTDDVVIDTGLGLVAGAGKVALSSLRITPGAALDINAGQFDITGGVMIDGALTLNKASLAAGSYSQGGADVKGDSASSIKVVKAFGQAEGMISGLGTLDITQAAGTLTLGNIQADTVNVQATTGGIAQRGGTALAVRLLQVGAAGDVVLPQANTIVGVQGNAGGALSLQGVAAVTGALTAAGDIALVGNALAINAGVTSSGGNVTLQADEVDVVGGSTVASASGVANFIKVHALSVAQPIKLSSLGGEDTGAGLLLNARDMAAFTTPTLVLGDAGGTGAVSLTDGGEIAAPNVSGTLRFANHAAVSRNGAETISANGLDITAVGGIALGGVNHVKSLTAANSGSGDIVFTNHSGEASLALGALVNPAGAITVDNTGGLVASGPAAITAQGKVTLVAHSPVTINTAISSGTGIAVTASTGISLGSAARMTNTAKGAIALLAQNGSVVLDAAARIDSGGGSTSLEARGAAGAVVAPAGVVTGTVVIASTELDNIAAAEAAAQAAAAQAAAEAAEKAAAEAAAKAAADKAAAEAAAKAAADKAAAEAAAKA
ncbi:MAG: filamentous hemagglutinin N-terminal domain-containing protein, partial [Burkholderiaceae bacterium]|nr:filamentous hemagglutinin N-terminal domain-containing protein [Burkholderiaceae bacterium]